MFAKDCTFRLGIHGTVANQNMNNGYQSAMYSNYANRYPPQQLVNLENGIMMAGGQNGSQMMNGLPANDFVAQPLSYANSSNVEG